MIKISNSKLISIFTRVFILLVVAKTISFGLWWLLPSNGVELNIKENYQPKYQRVSFSNMIKADIELETKLRKKDSGKSITNMVLKGLYGKGHNGFVIVAMKSTSQTTTIVEVGESYEGYELKSISSNSAKFYKNGSDFILSLEKVNTDSLITKVKPHDTTRVDDISTVFRSDIAYYANNPKQIWRDISINELKDGNQIKGFQVTKIKEGSKFFSLGLQKGDIIIKANNIALKSYKNVLEIYNTINKLDMIQIVVLRDNEEVELVYEIK